MVPAGGGGGGAKKNLADTVHLLSSTLYVHNMPSLITMAMMMMMMTTMMTTMVIMIMMTTMMTTVVMIMAMRIDVKRAPLVHFLVWRNPRQEGIRDKSA